MSSLGIFNKETQTYQKVAGSVGAAILDTTMSDASVNPVQNKVIKKYVDSKQVEVNVASKDKAGIVKPADGLVVAEDGTLKVNLDGTTLTMDQVNNVIKLADTLKEEINGALPATKVTTSHVITDPGYVLDARHANPNLSWTLAKEISDVQDGFKATGTTRPVSSPFSGLVSYVVRNGICYVTLWGISAPSEALSESTIVNGMPDALYSFGTFGEKAAGSPETGIFIYIDPTTGVIGCHKAAGCTNFYASFCYPVK